MSISCSIYINLNNGFHIHCHRYFYELITKYRFYDDNKPSIHQSLKNYFLCRSQVIGRERKDMKTMFYLP